MKEGNFALIDARLVCRWLYDGWSRRSDTCRETQVRGLLVLLKAAATGWHVTGVL